MPQAYYPDNRLFLLFVPSIIRNRPCLPLIGSGRIDVPPKDHDASELRDIAYCFGSLVVRDWIRWDRRRWIMVASSRIGCESRFRYFECESPMDGYREVC